MATSSVGGELVLCGYFLALLTPPPERQETPLQVCVEAGMLALRHDATIIKHEDFNDAVTEVQAKKKATLNYYA